MKRLKKLLCLILSLTMVAGILTQTDLTAEAAWSITRDQAIEWLYSMRGKNIDLDGGPNDVLINYPKQYYQCTDFVSAYMNYVETGTTKGPYKVYDAYNRFGYAGVGSPKWTYIKNYAEFVPQPGDCFYYPGHVGIVISSNVNSATIIDQNGDSKDWWTGDKITVRYDYSWIKHNVIYFWRYTGFANKKINIDVATCATKDATNITNCDATISGSVSGGTPYKWGIFIDTSYNLVNTCGAKEYYETSSSKNLSIKLSQIKDYKLFPATTYYYRMVAYTDNGSAFGAVKSFTTTNVKPEQPTLKLASTDFAIGDTISASWTIKGNGVPDNYMLRLYDADEKLVQEKQVPSTANSETLNALKTAGKYYVTIEAINSAGTNGETAKQEITVHPDVTVTFKDFDGTQLCDSQVIHYGKDAVAPSNPKRTGYTFDSWSGDYKSVKEDTDIIATYTINNYLVTFVDNNGNEIGAPQRVDYMSAAVAPEYNPSSGYKLFGWDKDFSHVTEDMRVTANIDWYNENYSVFAEIDRAERIVDSTDASNEGYDIDVTITNNNSSTSRGRVVVALQTAEGKLITTTESAAFSVIKNGKKSVNVFVPCDKYAKIAKVYLVSQYSNVVPIATAVSAEIDQSNAFSSWSTELPPDNAYEIETKTEYRFKTRSTRTSYETVLDGWTPIGSEWVQSGSGTIKYVPSWPAGFYTSSSIYKKYNNTPLIAYENATTKRTVSTTDGNYIYWHWCRGDHAGASANRYIEYTSGTHKTGSTTYTTNSFHCFETSTYYPYLADKDAVDHPYASACDSTKWWCSIASGNSTILRAKNCNYTDYKKLFTYEQWSDFTEWEAVPKILAPAPPSPYPTAKDTIEMDGPVPVTANENRIVETRKVYRYRTNEAIEEDNSGETRIISGNVGSENADKEAVLYIYKVDSASDYSNEYIGQTVIGSDGSYSFSFKLREEPTVQTGDFTAVLGIEGASTGIYLSGYDFLKAPAKTYTVKYFDFEGNVILEQTVEEGDDATLPNEDDMQREGYRFLYWTESNRNVHSNLNIYPEYELNEYAVVFVDWTSKSVVLQRFKHGDVLVFPELGEVEETQTIKWDTEAGTIVTGDMIVTSIIEDKIVNVEIEGFEGEKISEEIVPINTLVELPELEDGDDYIFIGWKIKNPTDDLESDLGSNIVSTNVIIYPKYIFANTVSDPQASIMEGEYSEAQTVELSCETPNATIWYTLDGTDPATSDTALEYTEAITIDESCQLRFIAMALGMNNSVEVNNLYAINDGGKAYHILHINCGGYAESTKALVQDGYSLNPDDFADLCEGHNFEGFFYDEECTDEFITGVETVIESITLYAKFTPKVYDVIFKNDDGVIVATEKVEYGASATEPEMKKPGYEFLGWDTEDYMCVTHDVIATAKWIHEDEFTTVRLNRSKLPIMEGTSFPLKATVKPASHTDRELVWESSDYSVATVENGVVDAIAVGTATITVTVVETGEKASCEVTVTGDIAKHLYLNLNSMLDVDSQGYLRRLVEGGNTVAKIREQFQNENLLFYSATGELLGEDALVTTKTVIKLFFDEMPADEMTCVMTGDYNCDGAINSKDSMMLNQYLLELKAADYPQQLAIDVNGDGEINNRDIAMLTRYLVGKEVIK